MQKPKLLVIVGQTASGKTTLSITLAKKYNGEVISADSRQVYKGLDIGSGKVTPEEMDGITHHLLDVAEPMEVYTAAHFKRDATTALTSIASRNHLPIIAGGTFFYVDTLLGRISHPEVAPDMKFRASLKDKSTEELFTQLHTLDPKRADSIDAHNRRRLERALEIVNELGAVPELNQPKSPYDVLTLGIALDPETLHHNIHTRLHERLAEGMVNEVERLLHEGVTHERLEELGLEYKYISRHVRGELSYEDMVAELEIKIRQFAKRQLTWLKRDESIEWINPSEEKVVFSTVETWLKR